MDSPKVSIIVPIYNAENFIQKTMGMLSRSTLKEIEILAINDGSTDSTLDKLKACVKKDERIKLFDKPNGGIFDARNYGLKFAKGDYICFCDQDDLVEPQMYEVMFNRAMNNRSECVICSSGRFNNNMDKYSYWAVEDQCIEGPDVKTELFLPLIFKHSNIYHGKKKIKIHGCVWECLISRKFIENFNITFRRYSSYEDDLLFVLDVLARTKKVSLVAEVLYYWRVNTSSASHTAKYVDDLYHKDYELQEAIIDIMDIAGCEKTYIEQFINSFSAYRFSRIVDNEIRHMSVRREYRIENIRVIYKEKGYKNKLKYARYLDKNYFARKIVCILLLFHWPSLAYFFWNLYKKIQKKYQTESWWAKLEKKMRFN